MARPTNEEVFARKVEIEAGAEAAVAAVQASYPQAKVIEGEVKEGADGVTAESYEVTIGWVDDAGATHILEVKLGLDMAILSSEERPDVPPGQAKAHGHGKPEKHEKPLRERKPKR